MSDLIARLREYIEGRSIYGRPHALEWLAELERELAELRAQQPDRIDIRNNPDGTLDEVVGRGRGHPASRSRHSLRERGLQTQPDKLLVREFTSQ